MGTHQMKVATELPNPILARIASFTTYGGDNDQMRDLQRTSRPLEKAIMSCQAEFNFNQERTIQITDSILTELNGLWRETVPPGRPKRAIQSPDGRTMSTFSNFLHGKDILTLIVEGRLCEWSKRPVQSDWYR